MTSNIPREQRYQMKVDVRGPDECWPWMAGHNKFGYGTFRGDDRSEQLAHRYGYKLVHGPIPPGICICHTCDNPECQNPAHWFPGTPGDNSDDKVAKGRHRWGPASPGESNGNAKLTDASVQEMIRLYQTGATQQEIADRFQITQVHVSRIFRGTRWQHITNAPGTRPPGATGSRNARTKLSADDVQIIRERYAGENVSQQSLADEYGVSQNAISSVIRGRTHTTISEPSS